MNTTYIASCSFGKDSIATILLAMIHNEPLDRIVSVEVMFDNQRGISGEDPDHIQWVKEYAMPKLKELTGIDVDLIRNEKEDYITQFFKKRGTRTKYPERIGKYQGFPTGGLCRMNSICKMTPLRKYFKQFDNYISYVGIASDEPKRLARLDGKKSISLLDKYGYTEQMAYELCKQYNLLSPIYKYGTRNGCWFCPNNKVRGFALLKQNHPNLWNELIELDKTPNRISNCFCYDKTISNIDRLIEWNKKQQVIDFTK